MAYIGIQPAEKFTSFATQTFSVSATTSYTLDHAVANENEIALFVNNVRQQPGSGKAYTATGTALTLSAATATTDTMYCIFLGRALQTVVPATNSITAAMVGNDLISGKDALTSAPADTDEFLISDAGTLKRIDASLVGEKNTPAFEAYLGSNTGYLTNNTYVKVQCNTEVYDTDSDYDNSSNYRFTPTVAGKYYVYGAVGANANGDDRLRNSYAVIYKNGSQYRDAAFNHSGNPGRSDVVFVSAVLDMNGSSDYVELYGAVNDNSGNNQGYFQSTDKYTYFGAFRITA